MIRLQDGYKDIRVTQTANWLVSNNWYMSLVAALDALHLVVPMSKVRFMAKVTPGEFEYKLTTLDGRVFTETIREIVGFDNYESDFSVTDFWNIRELVPHRVLRDIVVRLHLDAGLTDLKVDWT